MGRKKKEKSSSFVMVEKSIMKTPAWRKLNGSSVKLYLFLRSKTFAGLEVAITKTFKMPYSIMGEETGLARSTVRNSLVQLENMGFIDFVTQGGLKSGGLSCNEYAVSKRFLDYEKDTFEKGKMKKEKGIFDRGFGAVWKKKQRASMKIISA
jgi:hypothetical protein